MNSLFNHPGWTGILMAFLLLALPACTSFKGMFRSNEDPQMAALQREVRQIARSNATAHKTIEDVHDRLGALEAKVISLENTVEDLASPPQPATATVKEDIASPPKVAPKPPAAALKTKPPQTKMEKKPAPAKPAEMITKKAVVTPKRSVRREYENAYASYKAHRHDEALALFKAFIQSYPEHHLTDNAQYWIGEIYYDIQNYPNAILAFKEVVTHYGKENKAPDALLKIGYAYIALDDPNNARVFFKRVIKNYPFSHAEAKARAKLKELENL